MKLTYVFRRLSQYITNEMISQVYYGFVYPHIIYGIEVFGNACTSSIKKLQVVQNKLLKTLSGKSYRYSSRVLHNELKLLMVTDIYKLQLSLFVFKQRNRLLPQVFHNYYQTNGEVGLRSIRQENNLFVQFVKTTTGCKSTSITGAKIWNAIPRDIKSANSLGQFKKLHRQYLLSN